MTRWAHSLSLQPVFQEFGVARFPWLGDSHHTYDEGQLCKYSFTIAGPSDSTFTTNTGATGRPEGSRDRGPFGA